MNLNQSRRAVMPNIADFVILSDAIEVMQRGTGEGTNAVRHSFNLTAKFVNGSRGILMFRIEVEEASDFHYEIKINGTSIATFTHDEERFGTIHEVINANVLRFGDNDYSAVATSGDGVMKM